MQANPAGPKGVTPLHLAALHERGSCMAVALLDHCRMEEWTHTLTHDGLSPSDFAKKTGNHGMEREITDRTASATPPRSFRPLESVSGGRAYQAAVKFGTSPATSGSSKDSEFCLETGRFGPGRGLPACTTDFRPGPNTVSESEAGGSDSECELWPM
jgi:hypothetical protein